MDGKTKKITKKILLYVLLIILALIWIVPIFTLVATALKHKKDFILKRAETMIAIILRQKKYVNGMEIIRGL